MNVRQIITILAAAISTIGLAACAGGVGGGGAGSTSGQPTLGVTESGTVLTGLDSESGQIAHITQLNPSTESEIVTISVKNIGNASGNILVSPTVCSFAKNTNTPCAIKLRNNGSRLAYGEHSIILNNTVTGRIESYNFYTKPANGTPARPAEIPYDDGVGLPDGFQNGPIIVQNATGSTNTYSVANFAAGAMANSFTVPSGGLCFLDTGVVNGQPAWWDVASNNDTLVGGVPTYVQDVTNGHTPSFNPPLLYW